MQKTTLFFLVSLFGFMTSFAQGDCELASATPNPSGGVSWTRPLATGTGLSAVGIGVSYHIYGPFTVGTTGSYTFSSVQTGFDGLIFIYQNSFVPTTPLVNFVAGNDDEPTVGLSAITTTLTAGVDYYLITTGFDPSDFGSFVNTATGAGTVTCTALGTTVFNDNAFAYYPNPIENVLNVSYNQEIATVELFTIQGVKLSTNKINATTGQIDMSNLSTGAYMVKITANNQAKTIKVIKK